MRGRPRKAERDQERDAPINKVDPKLIGKEFDEDKEIRKANEGIVL